MPSGISQILSANVRHVPVLAYVNIQTPAGQFSTTPADFQAQMDWLEAQGYAPQKLSDTIRWTRGEMELPRLSCVLTFWDAQRSVIDNAFPILQAKNFKFNVFVSGAAVANEAALASGIFLRASDLQTMVASGLCELHAEGYHSLWSYKGIAVNVQRIYKSAEVNLKWGGIGEEVEDAYSFAPLIGTNNSLQPVVSTYTLTMLPRSYRGSYLWPVAPAGLSPLTPTQIVARHLFIDQLRVVGTVPGTLPLVKIYAKKSSDSTWTTLKTGWQPNWSAIYEVVTLDAPFTFRTGVRYDLKFETQSAAAAAGELVTLGNRTAKGFGGEATLVNSNSSAPPGFSNLQEGGDIYLLESLAVETEGETAARATADAQKGLDFLAPYQSASSGQGETAHAHAFSAYTFGTFFLPSSLRKIFPLQLWRQNLINDRWSSLDISHPQYAVNVPTGWPNRQLLAAFAVNGLRANTQIQSTIDALSGLAWDYAPDWDLWSVRLGYSHPYTPNFYTELAKYAPAFTHITTRGLRWNSDGTFAAGTQDASQATLDNLADFMKLKPVREHPRVLGYLHHFNAGSQTWDPDISRGVFQNRTAAVNSIMDLLQSLHPTLAGVVLDFEGCYKEDRSIASSFIQELWSRMQSEAPGRVLISFLPYKTVDDPNDSWSGWCDYDVWPQNSTYANVGTYDETFNTPGPIASISWMTAGLNFLATKIPKVQILIGMQFYGHWGFSATGAPPWTIFSGNYYDTIKAADDNDGTWGWDAAAQENFWQNGAATWKGYSATPRGFKAKLDNFVGDGYAGFSIWAIGHGDALFHKNAEEITAAAPLVKLPSGVGQRVNDREGSGSVGQFDVEVL
ncbi:MAG: polysaccharide deacetylase family protein, partial [Acidobacteria bacterium]|nr:polysaccharide deacetylase family protein [Acidobacteriota bacterium]